jgi:hypothetical protein
MLDKTEDIGPEADAPVEVNDALDFDPEIETLMGDVRDVMLGRIRTTRKPWEQMTEAEQTDLANGIDLAARDIVRRSVRLLARHEWPHVVATLEEIKIGGKNGVDIKMTCPNHSSHREVLGDHVKTMVQIVMVDSDQFMGQRAPVDIRPDQPDLPINDENNRPGESDLE